jgi:hypothetical protein
MPGDSEHVGVHTLLLPAGLLAATLTADVLTRQGSVSRALYQDGDFSAAAASTLTSIPGRTF